MMFMRKKKTQTQELNRKLATEPLVEETDTSLVESVEFDLKPEDFQGEDIYTQEQAWAKIGMILAKTKAPLTMSDLHESEIGRLAPIVAEEMLYDSDVLKGFVRSILLLRVSKNRGGRQELKEIATSSREDQAKRLRGLRGLFAGT